MINLKSFNEYNKKKNIILLAILSIAYMIEILIQFYNLNAIISSINNLPTNKLIIAKVFATIVYVIFKLISFIIIFSIYYFILSGFLSNFFNYELLKKDFMYFSTIANIAKVMLMNIITLLVIFTFKLNNISILDNNIVFTNITFILNAILNIMGIFIIYKFFDIKAKKQNYKKIPMHNFYIPYLIIIFANIIIKYII